MTSVIAARFCLLTVSGFLTPVFLIIRMFLSLASFVFVLPQQIMASHAVGLANGHLMKEGWHGLRSTEKTEARLPLVSWAPWKKMPTLQCRSSTLLCCRATPASRSGENRSSRENNGGWMEELGLSLSSMGTVAMEVRRQEDVADSASPGVSMENLHHWMQESVPDIVQNIEEAPFFVCLYSRKRGGATRVAREMVAAEEQRWPVMRRWVQEKCPDGIILVEELKVINQSEQEVTGNCSKLWGLLVQGRGSGLALCYVLKTTNVHSTIGFCTHFCLIKAKCYGDPVEAQLRDSWLGFEPW